MSELTREQQAMATHCLELNAAWTTSLDGENFKLLSDWEARGWAERVKSPAGYLAAFRITDLGRSALSEHESTKP